MAFARAQTRYLCQALSGLGGPRRQGPRMAGPARGRRPQAQGTFGAPRGPRGFAIIRRGLVGRGSS
eukprot:11295839-Alexandrium_andersonii.AAC.1